MQRSLKRRIIAVSIALSLPLAATPVTFAQTGGGGSLGCFGEGGFSGTSFSDLSNYLSGKFPKNGRVWQAPNDGEEFTTWCYLTNHEGAITDGVVKPSSVDLDDGTSIKLRTTSNSGGKTIDINSPNHSKLYKVHVA